MFSSSSSNSGVSVLYLLQLYNVEGQAGSIVSWQSLDTGGQRWVTAGHADMDPTVVWSVRRVK